MKLPKLALIDRDNTLIFASADPESPLYYVTELDRVVLKPGVKEAIELLRIHGIRMVLVTKQRCISKGLASREQVDLINRRTARLLNEPFEQIYVESTAEDKENLFKEVILDHRLDVSPVDMVLFDDSAREIKVAQKLGINAYDGSDLLASVKNLFCVL